MKKMELNEESKDFEDLKKEWYQNAKKIRTEKELSDFVHHLLNDYEHDYGTVCHAISAIALAGASLGARKEGITGFQAGFVMWGFVREWMYPNNKCGLKIINYDDILYPQYRYKFEKVLSRSTFERIKEEAEKRYISKSACHDVAEHWKSIMDGNVPFGYTIECEERR